MSFYHNVVTMNDSVMLYRQRQGPHAIQITLEGGILHDPPPEVSHIRVNIG
jgi:hypothetical protein